MLVDLKPSAVVNLLRDRRADISTFDRATTYSDGIRHGMPGLPIAVACCATSATPCRRSSTAMPDPALYQVGGRGRYARYRRASTVSCSDLPSADRGRAGEPRLVLYAAAALHADGVSIHRIAVLLGTGRATLLDPQAVATPLGSGASWPAVASSDAPASYATGPHGSARRNGAACIIDTEMAAADPPPHRRVLASYPGTLPDAEHQLAACMLADLPRLATAVGVARRLQEVMRRKGDERRTTC